MKALVWFVEEPLPNGKILLHDIKLTLREAALKAAMNPKWVVYGPCPLDIPVANPQEDKNE